MATMTPTRCWRVTDYDDSIGGEGEITCGAALTPVHGRLLCDRGHHWQAVPTFATRPECGGWKVTRGSA